MTPTPARLREIADRLARLGVLGIRFLDRHTDAANPGAVVDRPFPPPTDAAELRALADEMERDGWQPIETIPEGEALVMIWPGLTREYPLTISPKLLKHAMHPDTPKHLRLHPTSWHPLPAPPEVPR